MSHQWTGHLRHSGATDACERTRAVGTSERAVLEDRTGRRGRWMRVAGIGASLLLVAWLCAFAVSGLGLTPGGGSFLGSLALPKTSKPLAGDAHRPAPRQRRSEPRRAPAASAHRRDQAPVREAARAFARETRAAHQSSGVSAPSRSTAPRVRVGDSRRASTRKPRIEPQPSADGPPAHELPTEASPAPQPPPSQTESAPPPAPPAVAPPPPSPPPPPPPPPAPAPRPNPYHLPEIVLDVLDPPKPAGSP